MDALLAFLGFLLRFLLLPLKLYRSTDFEVHRNWLAITHERPLDEWYYEDTSPWTLDYPPAFAYFEWILAQVAQFVDPAMLVVKNLEYASPGTVLFQRCSVICGDVVLALGAYQVGGMKAVALMMWNSTLLIVDHVHFQYNGMLLGILLLSIASIERGRTYLGSALFCLLLCMKHIFLYVSPIFFVYLLRVHCGACLWPARLQWGKLLRLAAVVLACFGLLLTPFLLHLPQLLRRLFPFGRGLTHAYWAPNLWALYNTVDRVLAKLLGQRSSSGSTAGFAEVYESAVLWTVPPWVTFALTLAAYGPLLRKLWQAPQGLATFVALGSAVAFSFGWHVHEKAILMVLVPLLALAPRGELGKVSVALSAVSCFTVMPLLPLNNVETSVKWALFGAGLMVEIQLLCPDLGLTALGGPFPWSLVATSYVALGFFRDMGLSSWLLGDRLPFLPLLLTSDAGALLVLACFLAIYRTIPEKVKQ